MKLAPMPLTLGAKAHTTPSTAVGSWRIPFLIAPRVSRWRLHVDTFHVGTNSYLGSGVSLSRGYLGKHAGGGAFTETPEKILGEWTLNTGNEAVTDWNTSDIGSGVEQLFSFNLIGATTAPSQQSGFSWFCPSNTADDVAPATRAPQNFTPCGIWLEVEVEDDTPVLAVFGDSTSVGIGAARPVFDSPGNVWARAHNAVVSIYAGGSMTLSDWAAGGRKITRWDAYGADAALIALGVNDALAYGATYSTMKLAFYELANWIDRHITRDQNRTYAQTCTPSTGITGTGESVRRTFNLWLKQSQPIPTVLPNGVIDIVPVVSPDDETVYPSISPDGIHLTAAGNALIAKAWGDLGFSG